MSKLDAKVFSSITPFSKQWVDLTPRYNIDLGSLTWYKRTEEFYGTYFYTNITSWGIEYIARYQATVYPIYCSKYSTTSRDGMAVSDKSMCLDGSVGTVSQLQIKDNSFTGTAAQFKQYIAGTELVYAKTKEFNMYEFLYNYQDFLSNSYGIVDLGSFTWELDDGLFFAKAGSDYKPLGVANTPLLEGYCDKYPVINKDSLGQTVNKSINLGHNYYQIVIKDTSYASAADFKAAMQGVYLIFRLADNIGRVDMGTLEYDIVSDMFRAPLSSCKRGTQNLQLDGYTVATSWSNVVNTDQSIYKTTDTDYIFIHDDNYETVNAFKAHIDGKWLYYEKN